MRTIFAILFITSVSFSPMVFANHGSSQDKASHPDRKSTKHTHKTPHKGKHKKAQKSEKEKAEEEIGADKVNR